MPDAAGSFVNLFCLTGALAAACRLAWRDIQSRQVLDRELAWFAFFTALPRVLTYDGPAWASPSLPLWAGQLLDLARGCGGGLLLLALAVPGRLIPGRELIGGGDVLFALAAGFLLPGGASLAMVCLAFFLALPVSFFFLFVGRAEKPLPFIPFLALASLLLYCLPLPGFFTF